MHTYLEDHVGFAAIQIFQVIHTTLKATGDVLANNEVISELCALFWREVFGNYDDGT